VFATIVAVIYVLTALLWLFCTHQRLIRNFAYGLGFIAWFGHAWLLYQWTDLPTLDISQSYERVQNLHINNLFSLIIWAAILLTWLLACKHRRLVRISAIFFPLAAISIGLVQWSPGYYLLTAGQNISQLMHILTAVATFSVLTVAVLQAILMGIQDNYLRQKRVTGWLSLLPPLESMEAFLFTLIILGFAGLSIIILGSLLMLLNDQGHTTVNHAQSFYPAVLAWLVFLTILLGRMFYGWHGKTMIAWTISAILILMVSSLSMWLITGGV